MTTPHADLLPRRYVNVSAAATYSADLPDPLFRTYVRLCGLAWRDGLHQQTHLPQLSLAELAVLCHRNSHTLALHLRQLRASGFIAYTGDKHGYLIRICRPPTEQNFASPEQSFASPMMNDVVGVELHSTLENQDQQQHHDHQGAEQSFAASLTALTACGVNPQVPDAQAVAALPHVTPDLIAAWHAELLTRPGIRNLPGLLLYTLRTHTEPPRPETRGGARNPPAEPAAAQPAQPARPALPETLLNALDEIGFVGALDEIIAHYVNDPDFVTAWIEYTHTHRADYRNPAGYLRSALRGDAYPPQSLTLPEPMLPAPPAPLAPEVDLWKRTLRDLELQMTRATFDTWLRGSTCRGTNGDPQTLVVQVINTQAVAWLSNRLYPVIERTLRRVGENDALSVTFVTAEETRA